MKIVKIGLQLSLLLFSSTPEHQVPVCKSSCAKICFIWFVTLPVLTNVRHSYSPRGQAIVRLFHFTCDYSLPFAPASPARVSTIDANLTSSLLVLFPRHRYAKVPHQPYILFGSQVVSNFPFFNYSAIPVCRDLTYIESFCSAFRFIQPP